MTETKRTTKTADELVVGDWIAEGKLSPLPAMVLYAIAYQHPGADRVHLVLREYGMELPFTETQLADNQIELATVEELDGFRAGVDRAQRITELRSFADWLEANPSMPMPRINAHVHLDERHIGGPSPVEAYAKVRELADELGVKAEERLDDRTAVRKGFGFIEYEVIAWHPDGRPVELKPIQESDVEPVIHVALGAKPEHTQCGVAVTGLGSGASYVSSWSEISTCIECADQAPF